MRPLVGRVRGYAWGSRVALARLQGRPVPSAEPEAELWLGAHPSAPSHVGGQPLTELIAADPAGVLGTSQVERFGARLPYLLKLLAAAQPLSLQAHPDSEQAVEGFAHRGYVDADHKPEVLVALEEFEALCGFRDPLASAALLASFEVPALAPLITSLGTGDLRAAVTQILRWPVAERSALVSEVAAVGRKRATPEQPAFALAADLADLYPGDVGVVLALLLNHVHLHPDEAVFMPAGNLHAYLRGFGVEIMAASDNVLRGGLTPKHVDVDELLRILRYEVLATPVRGPVPLGPGMITWPAPVEEFSLVKAVATPSTPVALPDYGPRILVCVAGSARCRCGPAELLMVPGDAAFIDASEPRVTIASATDAPAILFQAGPAAR